jgi:hypothetical protein
MSVKYEILLSPSQRVSLLEFLRSMDNSFGALFQEIGKIDIEKSSAFHAADLARILDMVRRRCGFEKLNRIIMSKLQEWIIQVACAAAGSMDPSDEQRGVLEFAIGRIELDLGVHAHLYFVCICMRLIGQDRLHLSLCRYFHAHSSCISVWKDTWGMPREC